MLLLFPLFMYLRLGLVLMVLKTGVCNYILETEFIALTYYEIWRPQIFIPVSIIKLLQHLQISIEFLLPFVIN